MNREIKFRAWDGSGMLSPDEVGDHTLNDLEQLPWALMQFTGLHDKNGKEIYEGDILSYSKEEDEIVVRWNAEYAGFSPFIGGYYAGDPNNCEVIGNIYENSELLTN